MYGTGTDTMASSSTAVPHDEEVILNTSNRSNTNITVNSSSAEDWTRRVSARIGIDNSELVDTICNNLSQEYIREEWQLTALDSHQWQQLGAPMGLAAAIRQLSAVLETGAANNNSTASAVPATKPSLPSVISSASRLESSSGYNSGHGKRTSSMMRPSFLPPSSPRTLRKSTMVRTNNNSGTSGNRTSSIDSSGRIMSTATTAMLEALYENETSNFAEEEEEEYPIQAGELPFGDEEAPAPVNITTEAPPEGNKTSSSTSSSSSNQQATTPSTGAAAIPDDDIPPAMPVCAFTFRKRYQQFHKLPTNSRSTRSFPATSRFQQALLHSKSGPELKSHTVFWMELSILASALFLGAAVEMWGAFPLDKVNDGPLWAPNVMNNNEMEQEPHVPRTLAIVYHFVACATLIVQLFVTSGWIWILHATAAVSPFKFHSFLIQTRYVFTYFLAFSEIGMVLLTANICLLFSSMVAATTNDPIVLQLCYYMPVALIGLGCMIVHHFTSFIGRIAYHGLLLMDEDPQHVLAKLKQQQEEQRCNGTTCGSAKQAEADMADSFHHHNILCEARVLDVYHQSTTMLQEEENADDFHYPSLLDVIFPNKQPPPSSSKPPAAGGGGAGNTAAPASKKAQTEKKTM
jgi:hypothetical protein